VEVEGVSHTRVHTAAQKAARESCCAWRWSSVQTRSPACAAAPSLCMGCRGPSCPCPGGRESNCAGSWARCVCTRRQGMCGHVCAHEQSAGWRRAALVRAPPTTAPNMPACTRASDSLLGGALASRANNLFEAVGVVQRHPAVGHRARDRVHLLRIPQRATARVVRGATRRALLAVLSPAAHCASAKAGVAVAAAAAAVVPERTNSVVRVPTKVTRAPSPRVRSPPVRTGRKHLST
jgi:hypothetical protein